MKDILIFTLRDLDKSGGGAIRIKSLINAFRPLRGVMVASNTIDLNNVEYVNLGVRFSTLEKRVFQVLLSFFPAVIVKFAFWRKLELIENFFIENYDEVKQDVIFCEYLDNSLGSYLKDRGIIREYINDVHGAADIELSHNSSRNKLINKLAVYLAMKHDSLILSNASAHIYPSQAMADHFKDKYSSFGSSKTFIVPNLLNNECLEREVDTRFINDIVKRHKLDTSKKIIFFAGGYKDIGGVMDLITVFAGIIKYNPDSQLVLVGDGYNQSGIDRHISNLKLGRKVIQLGLQPYEKLYSIQHLADVIVCPDKANAYSNLIVHLKYFDSIVSGRPVVCGAFDSVKEINDIGGAILYPPSELDQMEQAISYCLENSNRLQKSLVKVRNKVKENLTYSSFSSVIASISTS